MTYLAIYWEQFLFSCEGPEGFDRNVHTPPQRSNFRGQRWQE